MMRKLLCLMLILGAFVAGCAEGQLWQPIDWPVLDSPRTKMIRQLTRIPELPVPHYWSITNEARKPTNRSMVRAVCRVMNGAMVTCGNADALVLASEMRAETGCNIAMYVGNHVDMTTNSVELYRKVLEAHASQNIPIDVIIFHYESPPADPEIITLYDDMFNEIFPGVPVAYYGWPGWSMSPFGAGQKDTYRAFDPPGEITCSDLYKQGADANAYILRQLRDFTTLRGVSYMPVLSHRGMYKSFWKGTPSNNNYAYVLNSRREPVCWWNMGYHMGVMAQRAPSMVGVYVYKSFFEPGADTQELIDDLQAYARGWAFKPL
jgi:hypothetical protein